MFSERKTNDRNASVDEDRTPAQRKNASLFLSANGNKPHHAMEGGDCDSDDMRASSLSFSVLEGVNEGSKEDEKLGRGCEEDDQVRGGDVSEGQSDITCVEQQFLVNEDRSCTPCSASASTACTQDNDNTSGAVAVATASVDSGVDTDSVGALEDVVDLLVQDPEVVRAIQNGVASLLLGSAASAITAHWHTDNDFEDSKPASTPSMPDSLVSDECTGGKSLSLDGFSTSTLKRQVIRSVVLSDERVGEILRERQLMQSSHGAGSSMNRIVRSVTSGASSSSGKGENSLFASDTDNMGVAADISIGRQGRLRHRILPPAKKTSDTRGVTRGRIGAAPPRRNFCGVGNESGSLAATKSRATATSESTAPPPVKSVSFSSVSAPHFDMDDDDYDAEHGYNNNHDSTDYEFEGSSPNHDAYEAARRRRSRQRGIRPFRSSSSSSLPVSSSSEVGHVHDYYHFNSSMDRRRRGRSHSPSATHTNAASVASSVSSASSHQPHHAVAQSASATLNDSFREREHDRDSTPSPTIPAGEATASDSSVASGYQGHTGGTLSVAQHVGAASAFSTPTPQVHFSAINPNPQLVLDHQQHQQGNSHGSFRSGGSMTSSAASQEVEQQQQQQQHHHHQHIPIVRFMIDRAVSFEDEYNATGSTTGNTTSASGGGSRASRSGLSSPSIEPALSPPRSRSRSPLQIHFDESATATITEAAARLRRQQRSHQDNVEGIGSANLLASESRHDRDDIGTQRPRVVHFSAMRDITVVDTDAAAAESLTTSHMPAHDAPQSNVTFNGSSCNSVLHHAVHFADDGMDSSHANGSRHQFVPITSSAQYDHDSCHSNEHRNDDRTFDRESDDNLIRHTETEMRAAAERLRRLIRRAEQVDNVTLEDAFAHFDADHSGTITPRDLQIGLRTLGESFSFSLEECSALLACLSDGVNGSSRRSYDWHHNRQHLRNCDEDSNGDGNRSSGSELLGQGPGITLLGFYRAMGRRSPPPAADVDIDQDAAASDALCRQGRGEDDCNSESRNFNASATVTSVRGRVDLASSPVVHALEAASRLREIVLEAEQNDGMPLESSFRLLDPAGTGYISASDFHIGLRQLGRRRGRRSINFRVEGMHRVTDGTSSDISTEGIDSELNETADVQGTDRDRVEYEDDNAFASIDDDDCEELVALFDTNNDGLVSLLDFYRFMGRRSPPPRGDEGVQDGEPASDSGNNDFEHDSSDQSEASNLS